MGDEPSDFTALAAVGDVVFVAHGQGIYRSPPPGQRDWSLVLPGTFSNRYEFNFPVVTASEDGKALVVIRSKPGRADTEPLVLQRVRYEPATGKTTMEDVPAQETEPYTWGRMPSEKLTLQTPYATWTATPGQLLRQPRSSEKTP